MGNKHQTTDATAVTRIIASGVTVKELSKEFGVSAGTIRGWVKAGSAPYWTRCAVEALERRRGRASKVFLLVELPTRNDQAVASVIKAMGGEVHLSINL